MSKLSDLIKSRRKTDGLSLRQFSEKCNLSHTYVKNLEEHSPETGKEIVPTIDSLAKLAPALNMSLQELLQETGYIDNKNRKFVSSNLKLIRGKKSYEEVVKDMAVITGQEFDPFVYEDLENGGDKNPSPFLLDMLAKYAGVEISFFYRNNSDRDLEYAKLDTPYNNRQTARECICNVKDKAIKEFLNSHGNEEYLRLAKELYDKKIKVKLVRDIFFED